MKRELLFFILGGFAGWALGTRQHSYRESKRDEAIRRARQLAEESWGSARSAATGGHPEDINQM